MSQQNAISMQSEKNYSIGIPQKSYIGAPMIRVQKYSVKADEYAVPITNISMKPPIPLGWFSASGGSRIKIIGTAVHNNETFFIIPLQPAGAMMAQGAALVRRDGSIYNHLFVAGGLITPDSYTIEPENARFVIKEVRDATGLGGNDNFELIYSGINNGNIRILYREYTGDNIARASFSQELTYEKGSRQIRFRNILIKINGISNEDIRFTVIGD